MLRISKQDKENILQLIRAGKIDAVSLSTSNLIDDIILSMSKNGIIDCIKNGFQDKRADNTIIPPEIITTLAIAAKMRVHSSLTDIPFALTDHRTICELGYSLWNTERDINEGLMTEGAIRAFLNKYSSDELIEVYNSIVQAYIMPTMDMQSDIHILDCTKLEVNLKNENYQGSAVYKDNDGNAARGYKLSTLRGIVGDTGIIEEIRFGSIRDHDLQLSEEMLRTSPMFKPGHILINDRGFLSRDLTNYLKTNRQVDTYIVTVKPSPPCNVPVPPHTTAAARRSAQLCNWAWSRKAT